jgi:hypothetical protein
MLEALGLHRKPHDVTPDLVAYARDITMREAAP